MKNNCILMVVTSGAGLGHLTRALAVAKQIRRKEPSMELIFVTSSNALEVIRNEGFLFYYIPSRKDTSPIVSNLGWMHQMEAFLKEIICLHKPKAVIYEAAYPYQSISQLLEECGIEKTVWIKRECYKPGFDLLDRMEERFGIVITPMELQGEVVKNTRHKKYVSPIMNLDLQKVYAREQVRQKYHISNRELLVYVQLGAGIINNIEDIRGRTIEVLKSRRRVKIMVGEYIIVPKAVHDADVLVVREYPVSLYFHGIDLAISAAGYNSFHELLACKVPTLFIPNKKTRIDDQYKRAMLAQQNGYGLCLKNEEHVEEGIDQLFENRKQLRRMLDSYSCENGAAEAADYILQYVEGK